MWVRYAVDIDGWDETSRSLTAYTQSNPLLDAQRQVLADEFPRRKFETELRITVGGHNADSGSYWTGRERVMGVARLEDLRDRHKLGLVGGSHLITKRFDRDNHAADESLYVSLEVRFTHPKLTERRPEASVFVGAQGTFGELHLPTVANAAWTVFERLVDIAPPASAIAHWHGAGSEPDFHHERPVGAFMLLEPRVVERLGGAAAAAAALQAEGWNAVRGDERNGITVRLSRIPEDMPSERIEQVRSVIAHAVE